MVLKIVHSLLLTLERLISIPLILSLTGFYETGPAKFMDIIKS